ncbi:hypothetical protein [Methylobacterium sp. BTF04]|uniref:hypothetical protein n=1 Tax=Methylobacterium sp. BTF04 TaxID=2708300 RepID=UPI001FEE57E5|nr:hypothetical protein [Methylobacterium sp. BTF04]
MFDEPNGPSVGNLVRIELSAFLGSNKGSPEHRALLTMIGSLVEAGHTDPVRGPEPGTAGAEPTPGEATTTI